MNLIIFVLLLKTLWTLIKKINNVGAHPRESFLLVRKPTKRRLASNPDKSKGSFDAISPVNLSRDANSINILHPDTKLATIESSHARSYYSSHDDDLKSVSFSTEKIMSFFPSDRELKCQGFASNKGSIFRTSHLQNIEKMTHSRLSIPSSVKLDEASVNLSVTDRKILPKKHKSESFFSRANFRIQAQRSQGDQKYLRAVNDKAEFLDEELVTHNDTTDRRLRGLLKKHAIKKKKTLVMKDIVKKGKSGAIKDMDRE